VLTLDVAARSHGGTQIDISGGIIFHNSNDVGRISVNKSGDFFDLIVLFF
jgi:hypothetical protein